MHSLAVCPHQSHRQIDGGMVGDLQKEDLRCAKEQRCLHERRLRGRTPFQKKRDEMAQRAEPAQHRRGERPRERAVALGKRGKAEGSGTGAVQHPIERTAPTQHAVDDVGGYAPGRKARHRVGIGSAHRRFPRTPHGGNCSSRTSRLQIWHGYAKSGAMPTDRDQPLPPQPANEAVPDAAAQQPPLAPAAQRALAEAAARSADRERKVADQPKEVGGRDGPDPTRYGDWEINGLASDF